MVSKTTVIGNPSGLHLRPVRVLCKEVLRHKSEVSFKVRTTTTNVKSALNVLGVCVKSGDEIEFIYEEPDEKETLEAVVGIMEAELGE